MKPIGLKYKNPEINSYTGGVTGELMIIHQCSNCGHFSSNRVAGDDNPYEILDLLKDPFQIGKIDNMDLLTMENKNEVLCALFGYDYQDR